MRGEGDRREGGRKGGRKRGREYIILLDFLTDTLDNLLQRTTGPTHNNDQIKSHTENKQNIMSKS